jgi:hypothetical protein
MSLLKNRISAVVAGTSVLVAVGATGAVAGDMIGTQDIRNGGVHRVDLSDGVQNRIDNKATDGQVKGLKGRVSQLEGQSDSGSDLIVGAGFTSTWKAHSFGETIETCPEGQYAIGGGFSTFGGFEGMHDGYDLGGTNRNIEVTVSAPYFQGEYEPVDEAGNFLADQWVVRGYNNGDQDQVVRAWVVCSNLAD